MRIFYKLISNIANSLMNVVVPSSLSQQMNQIDSPFGKPNNEEFEEDLEKASNEGIVLLKNKDKTLPLIKDSKIAIFGRTYIDYFYVGNGSGGNVIPPFKLSPYQVFKDQDYLKVDQNIENYYLYQPIDSLHYCFYIRDLMNILTYLKNYDKDKFSDFLEKIKVYKFINQYL